MILYDVLAVFILSSHLMMMMMMMMIRLCDVCCLCLTVEHYILVEHGGTSTIFTAILCRYSLHDACVCELNHKWRSQGF